MLTGSCPERCLLQSDRVVAVISFTARAGAVGIVILLWCWGGQPWEAHGPLQPPHVCTHGVQPSSAPVLMPSPETQAKGPLRLACAAADGDGAVLCHPGSNVPAPRRAPGQRLSVLGVCELSPKGSQEEAEKKQTDAGHVCPRDI